MLLVVEDTKVFHEENMSLNYKHYSYFAKRMPLNITNRVQNGIGSALYFNPLIPLRNFEGFTTVQDGRKLKYGVI